MDDITNRRKKKKSPKKQNLTTQKFVEFLDINNGIIYMQVYDKESEPLTCWSSKVSKLSKLNGLLDLQITDQI